MNTNKMPYDNGLRITASICYQLARFHGFVFSRYFSYAALITMALAGSVTANAQVSKDIMQATAIFPKDTIFISQKGAVGDGKMLNTAIINASIETLHKKGGGVIMVPAGLWLTGPIVLQSNINLHIARGATLLFTKDKREYPLIKGNWEGLDQMRMQSPISADNATHIAITGEGIIDGNGDGWRMVKKDKLTDSQWKKLLASGGVLSEDKKSWFPSEQFKKANSMTNPGAISPEKDAAFYAGIKDFLRPNMVVLTNCRNILLEGVTFQNSPAWCLHPLMSENIVVRNIFVKNPWYAQNGDGIDVESCKNVLIENSVFDVGDDALCMKSGRDAAGRTRAMPTENVSITGCTVYASHGGFVIGSEMSGGVKNVYVSKCTFIGSDIGLRFKSARGRGGVVENVLIEDIFMKDIGGDAILFDMYYMAKDPIALEGESRVLPTIEAMPKDETTPVFRNFVVRNVYCHGAQRGIFVRGLPEQPVENILLENMVLQAAEGIHVQDARAIAFLNIAMLANQTGPGVDIIQSEKLLFDKVSFTENSNTWYRLSGEKCNAIVVATTDKIAAKEKTNISLGATPAAITYQ